MIPDLLYSLDIVCISCNVVGNSAELYGVFTRARFLELTERLGLYRKGFGSEKH